MPPGLPHVAAIALRARAGPGRARARASPRSRPARAPLRRAPPSGARRHASPSSPPSCASRKARCCSTPSSSSRSTRRSRRRCSAASRSTSCSSSSSTRRRWYWFDEKVAADVAARTASRDNALTRQYRVASGLLAQTLRLAGGGRAPARARDVARRRARGRARAGHALRGRVRLRLDVNQLPKPFQVNALASREWHARRRSRQRWRSSAVSPHPLPRGRCAGCCWSRRACPRSRCSCSRRRRANTALFAQRLRHAARRSTACWSAADAARRLAAVAAAAQPARRGVFGSRLAVRLVLLFALVAVLPGALVYAVSVQFIGRSIESWFDVRVDRALEGGLNLGRNALDYLLQGNARTRPTQMARGARRQRRAACRRALNRAPPSRPASTRRRCSRRPAACSRSPASAARARRRSRRPRRRCAARGCSRPTRRSSSARTAAWCCASWCRSTARPPRAAQAAAGRSSRCRKALAQEVEKVQAGWRDYQEISFSRKALKRLYALTLTLTLLLALTSRARPRRRAVRALRRAARPARRGHARGRAGRLHAPPAGRCRATSSAC